MKPITQQQVQQYQQSNQSRPAAQQVQQTAPQVQQQTPQPNQPWDYRTSQVNQKGETLPKGAESWTPLGLPYFGRGIAGTVKKYAWALFGSPTQGAEADRWAKFYEMTSNGDASDTGEAIKIFGQGLAGTPATQQTVKEDLAKRDAAAARLKEIATQYDLAKTHNFDAMPPEVRKEYEQLQKDYSGNFGEIAEGKLSKNVGGQNYSLLTPLLRLSKVGMTALMDVLGEAAIKLEQVQGVNAAVRDYANENSKLPDLAFDVDRKSEEKSEGWQNSINIASRALVAPLAAWDAMRFWSAPGTLKDKTKAISEGWDAGRMLYSQAIKPSLLEEYKRRVADGEDPQLLAMELQNPWAEAIGQFVLDPLNIVGALSKGAKIAGQIDKAQDAVSGGKLGEVAAEIMKDSEKLGETRAVGKMEEFDGLVTQAVDRIEKARLTPEYNKWTAYSPSGMRVRELKTVGETSSIVTSAIMRNGGGADEVADFFHYLSQATSTDQKIRASAWDDIFTLSQRFGLGRYAMSDDMLETGVLLRNLTEDKDLLTVLKAGKGDLAETAKILDRTFQKAVEKQIPTVKELKNASETVAKGEKVTEEVTKKAAMYEQLKPGTKTLWNLQEGKLGDFKQGVNSFLGKFFFAQPGFVSRNASNNFVTMFVDSGFKGTAKSFYRDGKYWSIAEIENDLKSYFGGKLPPATGGISLSKVEKAESAVTKLNDMVESGFAKRIYWSRFRDTMDKFMRPGVALPSKQEFQALGMNDEAISAFTHILKNETHGNVEQAIIKYSEDFDTNGFLDTWKRWQGSVTIEEMDGLAEIGLTKEIDTIKSTAKTPQEISERISKLRNEIKTRAASVTDNPIGVNREKQGYQFMEGIGQATKDGLLDTDGTNKLSILIEQSDKASEEFMKALGQARNKVVDPAMREQFGIMEEAFSPTARTAVRQTAQQATDAAWQFTKQARKSTGLGVEKLWNESILAKTGPAPKGLTQQQFLDELWKATRNEVSNKWDNYFSEGFDRLNPLVDQLTEQFPELQPLFSKAQKSSAELNMYRTAKYSGGKILYSKPPATIAELAQRYGVASATEAGVPMDKSLLATINKYSDVKYKTLDEIPMGEAEKAFQARRAEKATQGGEATKKASNIQTPEFKKWFGNSKVVDDSGKPKVVYHGTDADFTEFDFERKGQNFGREDNYFYFTDKAEDAGTYAIGTQSTDPLGYMRGRNRPNVKPVYLALENPLQLKIKGDPTDYLDLNREKIFKQVLDGGHDGVMVTGDGSTIYGARFPEQIKSQFNPGTFDPNSGNLLDNVEFDETGKIIPPKNPEVEIAPPYVDGSTPIPGQMWKENSDGVLNALNKVERHMIDNYGLKAVDKLEGSQLKGLKTLMQKSAGKITEGMAVADKVGKEWRDFALLPYGETKNFDLALSYVFPYQFWYSRSYNNWMKRVATDPQVIANYARLKEAMSRINKESPEWWRYNVEIPSHFLGLPNKHPMSFNLEANLWPLYGLTGTDFNDPQKRQNWLTSTIDDMGKFGPSPFSPIQWAVALAYRAKGEDEIAQAWAGRVIPQTATIKAVSSYFGKPLELDPMVQLFSGKGLMDFDAMDKYERNRVGRSLAAMVQEGLITQEQSVEIARTQDGPVWDEAVKRAVNIRAPGQILSYFGGVGMKARTEEDRVTDEFYQQYYRLQNLNQEGLIGPQEYQQAWDSLRDTYPFMDALLLSRKAGPDRDKAYAYNVLGRIPPGQSSDIYKLVGISPELAQKYFDSKGDTSKWSESEREGFMAKMIDLGAMLSIPEYSTKQDWNAARNAYRSVQDQMKQTFGEDIQDTIDDYYGIEDSDQRKQYLQSHPEVEQALSFQNEQVVNNPTLYQFYGGISTLEKYHKGKVYDQLEKKYGSDIQDKFDTYYNMQLSDPAGAKKYYKQHPELKAYNKEKKGLMDQALRNIVEFAARLPEEQKPEGTGNEPASIAQQNIQDYTQQKTPSFTEFQQALPIETRLLQQYWYGGGNVPSELERSLDFKAKQFGYPDGEALMQAILVSMNQSMPQ